MANMTFKANLIPASNTALELGKSGSNNANYWNNVYAKTVTLSQDPVNNLEAATKRYVDNKIEDLGFEIPIFFGSGWQVDSSIKGSDVLANIEHCYLNIDGYGKVNVDNYLIDTVSGGTIITIFAKAYENINSTGEEYAIFKVHALGDSTATPTVEELDSFIPTTNNYIESYNNSTLTDNAIIVGAGNKALKSSNLSINGTTISSSNNLYLYNDNLIDLSSDDTINMYGINTVDIYTDNSQVSLETSGMTISDNSTITLSTPRTTSTSINLTSKNININADSIKLPGDYYCSSNRFYREGNVTIDAEGQGDAMLALRAGWQQSASYVDISDQQSGIVISTVDSECDITIQSYDKININGKMILTENINYGSSLPNSGTTGQIFFKFV